MNLKAPFPVTLHYSISDMMTYLDERGFRCSVETREFSTEEVRGDWTTEPREVIVVRELIRSGGSELLPAYDRVEILVADEYDFRSKSNVLIETFSNLLAKSLLNKSPLNQ